MAQAESPSQAQRYVVRYTIRDREHENRQTTTQKFRGPPTGQQVAHALVDLLRCEDGDLATQQQAAWRQYRRDRHREIPGDYRIVEEIASELAHPAECNHCRTAPCACIPAGEEQDRDWEHGRQMVTTAELVEAVVRLLECPDLKVDELNAISMEAIAFARRVIAKTQGGA